MLVNNKPTDCTVSKSVDTRMKKADRQEVVAAITRAGKKYGKMLSRLSK